MFCRQNIIDFPPILIFLFAFFGIFPWVIGFGFGSIGTRFERKLPAFVLMLIITIAFIAFFGSTWEWQVVAFMSITPLLCEIFGFASADWKHGTGKWILTGILTFIIFIIIFSALVLFYTVWF